MRVVLGRKPSLPPSVARKSILATRWDSASNFYRGVLELFVVSGGGGVIGHTNALRALLWVGGGFLLAGIRPEVLTSLCNENESKSAALPLTSASR